MSDKRYQYHRYGQGNTFYPPRLVHARPNSLTATNIPLVRL